MTDGQSQLNRIEEASKFMKLANVAFKDHSKNAIEYECDYRIACAKKILQLKDEGISTTIINNLAYGDEKVANLKKKWGIEHGLMKSAESAIVNFRTEYKILSGQAQSDMFG